MPSPQVATKRVKHAIKSDIPSVTDPISKLVHIGKATVDKLQDIRKAAHEEGFKIKVRCALHAKRAWRARGCACGGVLVHVCGVQRVSKGACILGNRRALDAKMLGVGASACSTCSSTEV